MSRDPFVSYAQNQEDVVLARALRPDDREGFWVDVGAGDPVLDSVTAAFAERGWRGVNVEPLPREHGRLCAARPADTNLRVALGATAGEGKLFVEPTEKPEWPGPDAPIDRGASTMVPEIAERYRADGQEFTPIEVPIWTLAQVVADHVPGLVDFLKVDVEGFEREVLAGVDWRSFRPRVVVIEATVPKSDQPAHEVWEPTLLEAGYRLALFDGLNRFYAHADEPALLQALATPANVFDDFVPYEWTRQVDQAQQWSHSLEEALTLAHQEREQLYESLALARATTRGAQARAAIADESAARTLAEAHRVCTELHALRTTRTFRYTAPLRRIYANLRRRSSKPAWRRSPIEAPKGKHPPP
jgi:FkbM family methyltransferase